jgi:hypothetical protein
MEEMSRRNRELFRLPPYVLYVSRAFSTLEGIGLSINPDYSILQECYPYLARRLLTDNSPRAKEALRAMLLGNSTVFSPDKLKEMMDGFSSYTAATVSPSEGDGKRQAELALVRLLVSSQGNFVQDIIVEGAAKTTDAIVRKSLYRAATSTSGKLLQNLIATPSNLVHSLLPKSLQSLAIPLTLPYELLSAGIESLKENEEDTEALARLNSLVELTRLASANISPTTSIPASPITLLSSTQSQVDAISRVLTDPDSRVRALLSDSEIQQQIPRTASTLSRKLVGALLNRAAERVDQAVKIALSSKSPNNQTMINGEILQNAGNFASSTARRLANVLSSQQ